MIRYLLLALCGFFVACQSDNAGKDLGNAIRGEDGTLLSNIDSVIPEVDTTPPAPIQPRTVSIIGVGDMMIGSDYPSSSSLPPDGGNGIFEHVTEYLEDADLTFGNLEGVLGRGGKAKYCGDSKYCYTFRMPAEYADHFVNAGFDVVATANNHANDFGQGGRDVTAENLEAAGIYFAGSEDKPYTTFEKDGVKYGFLAAAPNRGCFNFRHYDKAAEYVEMLDSTCDIVIVSFHSGAEGAKYRHTPCKDEVFLGHNRGNVCKFAKDCIDAGADVIFGHGPHVTRGIELYKDRFIIYSMGNFCTYEKFSLAGSKGVGPIMKIEVEVGTGAFVSGQIIPTKQHGRGIPKYDEENTVIDEIIELSTDDFPDSPLDIAEDGMVTRRVE